MMSPSSSKLGLFSANINHVGRSACTLLASQEARRRLAEEVEAEAMANKRAAFRNCNKTN